MKGMKMGNKTIFVMLLIWATPLCAKGAEIAEPNISKQEQHTTLNGKPEAEPINNDPNEQKESITVVNNDNAKGTSITKSEEVQYTQLLAVHRSYFTVFLQVLSIYLTVMGVCLKIVSDDIQDMKDPIKRTTASKTVLFTMVGFALVASVLFLVGIRYGRFDAIARGKQIIEVSKALHIEAINTDLLTSLFTVIAVGTQLIVIAWYVMFIRSLKACVNNPKWSLILGTLPILIYSLVCFTQSHYLWVKKYLVNYYAFWACILLTIFITITVLRINRRFFVLCAPQRKQANDGINQKPNQGPSK